MLRRKLEISRKTGYNIFNRYKDCWDGKLKNYLLRKQRSGI